MIVHEKSIKNKIFNVIFLIKNKSNVLGIIITKIHHEVSCQENNYLSFIFRTCVVVFYLFRKIWSNAENLHMRL